MASRGALAGLKHLILGRISVRVTLAVAFAVITIFGIFSVLLNRSYHRFALAQIEHNASQLSETIKRSTKHAMMTNDPDHVHEIIDSIGAQEGIEKVRIFNKSGEIIYSPDKSLVGKMVDQETEACFACHQEDSPLERLPSQDRTRIFTGPDGDRALGIINPIYNEPTCWTAECHSHDKEQLVLGVLDVTMSLEEVDQLFASSRLMVIALVIGGIVAIGFIIWLSLKLLVGRPVQRLVDATQAVADGDLDHRLEGHRGDELGRLATSFNAMTENLKQAQSQILRSNKLASLGRLAAGVAHEINNPLTGVLTFSSFLLKRAKEGSEDREDLDTIVRETKRCREIVKGLLDFSRQVPPRKSRSNINTMVDRALTIVSNQLKVNHVSVTKTLAANPPDVLADGNQLVQILINLLVNASDAIGDKGGDIYISTCVANFEGQPHVAIKVADSGCGMPAEILGEIYDPFFSTKGTKGTGLGLSVVWGIVDEHDGTIQVESQAGRGTTFTIFLPVDEKISLIVGRKRS